MRVTYRQDKQTGEVTTIERWKAEARLTLHYRDEKTELAAATQSAPVETPGALYWMEDSK